MGLRLSSGAGVVWGGVRGAVEGEGWPGSAVIQARLGPTFMRGPESTEMWGAQHRAAGPLRRVVQGEGTGDQGWEGLRGVGRGGLRPRRCPGCFGGERAEIAEQ